MTEQGQGVAQPPYPREPNVHSGGKQDPGGDRDLPPYHDLKNTGSGEEAGEGTPTSHEAGPRDISQAEREGVSDTDMAPSGPHGVGESPSTSGEDFARGKSEDAQRAGRLNTGVSDEEATGPAMHSGDQGG